MKNKIIIILYLLLVGCNGSENSVRKLHSESFQTLWQNTIDSALSEPLWLPEYAYDASASLMLPMHYAYRYPTRFDVDPRIAFQRFARDSYSNVEFENYSFVTKAQYIYFLTQYLSVQSKDGLSDVDIAMLHWVSAELENVWLNDDAFHWDKSLNLKGVKGRLEWNFSNPTTDFSFYRAIIDEDWFTLAALNDLAQIYSRLKLDFPLNNDEIKFISKQVITEFGQFEGEYWFFQRGVWHDHRDYIYAGQSIIVDEMDVAKIENIGVDSSHSHRMPLWLSSFRNNNDDAFQLYSDVLNGFVNAYEDLVLTSKTVTENEAEIFLNNNYMTGENGVYRFNYETQGEGNGYNPFELSGTLFIGYYAFSGSKKYQQAMGVIE